MFKNSKQNSKVPENLKIDTVIAGGTRVKGDFSGQGAIRVDGIVEGNVEMSDGVILGEKGNIVGNIKSSQVVVYGKLDGDLSCKQLFVKHSGIINGNLSVESFSVEMGGKYNGNLRMLGEETVALHPEEIRAQEVSQQAYQG